MVITSFFETRFLEFLTVVRQNKWFFLESWDKTEQDDMFLKENCGLKKMIFLPELDLILGQIWKWISPSNSTCQMTHKTCITWHSCYIFIWSPHFTWHWPVFRISLLFTWHFRHTFSSIFAEFALAAVSGLVSAADKAKRVRLDLWPNFHPTFDLAKKILRLHYNPLVEGF